MSSNASVGSSGVGALQRAAVSSSSGASSSGGGGRPDFTFGMIADVQYADCEDGYNFSGHIKRHFRNSLDIARRAVEAWNAEPRPMSFVANLGDTIDGRNEPRGESKRALDSVLEVLGGVRGAPPTFHAVGNHELYNFSREELLAWMVPTWVLSGVRESSVRGGGARDRETERWRDGDKDR